jgi:hypothetical protein
MIVAVIVAAMVFKEDGDKVLDLIGRDVLTESKAASDLDLVGAMTDELKKDGDVIPIGVIADATNEMIAGASPWFDEWGLLMT